MAERIESWKSNDGVICANEFDAVTQDFREWLTANVRAINQPIVTALISAVTHDITALRDFASIVEAISAAHPGQPIASSYNEVTVPNARFDPAVEELASRIFWAMTDRPAGLIWTPHGNSEMQDKARDLARQQIEEAAKHVEPAHDIATLTPEQVLDQARGYTRGEQPFVDKVQLQPFGLNPGDPLNAHPDYIGRNSVLGACEHGIWYGCACEKCGRPGPTKS